MAETIAEDDYFEKVRFLAGCAVGEAEEDHPENPEGNICEVVSDVLYGQEWFTRSWFGPAAHGCIIEHSEYDPEHFDPAILDEESPAEAMKQMAYYALERDVIGEARERLSRHG